MLHLNRWISKFNTRVYTFRSHAIHSFAKSEQSDASTKYPSIVSTQWLSENLTKVKVIDGSWYKPKPVDRFAWTKSTHVDRDPKSEHRQIRIETSRFFDIEECSDPLSKFPRILPSEEEFGKYVGENCGITNEDHVVIYDTAGVYSSPRVWWMFKSFGHEKVSILDGGLFKWVTEKRHVISGEIPETPSTKFNATCDSNVVIKYEQLLVHSMDFMFDKQFTIIDTRSPAKFSGYSGPANYDTLPGGHIPASINVPVNELIQLSTSKEREFVSKENVLEILKRKNVDLVRPFVTISEDSISAATMFLALEIAGFKDIRVYEGGWREWSSKARSPIKVFGY